MLRRYTDEPVPSERPGVTADELRTLPPTDHTSTTGTGDLNDPNRQRGTSLSYHRAPIGTGLTTAPQDIDLGVEVKQAGAGRAFISPGLAFPEAQSTTPEPDRRRIARPMPTMARDQAEVVRPMGGA